MNDRARQSTGNADVPFGTHLRRARESAGLTQEALAERAGLTPNSVGALERGEHRHPYPATVRALAEALGLTELERATLARSVPMRNRTTGGSASHIADVPVPLSPLIGREREVASVTGLLQQEGLRLVTLSGPGGVGKTRLALHVAAELKSVFRDGIVFVSLASIRDPALVAPAIARALSLGEDFARSPETGVSDALRSRHLLLVLDNFEHLPDAAPLVTHLLVRCPRLVALVTSRTPLRVDGERDLPVPPLGVPDPERLADSENLAEVAAVQLFVERAREVDPTFTLTPTNSAAVAAICLRLDGLPLAIELAAARSRLLPPAALLTRLAHRLPLLIGGRRDAPARHQTMRSAIAWSHELLSPEEQSLFRFLAIFAGGCSLEAAETVCGPLCNESVVNGISALIEHGLLYRTDGQTASRESPCWKQSESMRWNSSLSPGRSTPFQLRTRPGSSGWQSAPHPSGSHPRRLSGEIASKPSTTTCVRHCHTPPSWAREMLAFASPGGSGRSGSFAVTRRKVAHGWSRCWSPGTTRGRLIMSAY